MNKEKVKEVIEKNLKSRAWEVIFVLIYPIIILLITEGINESYTIDKLLRVNGIINLNVYSLLSNLIMPYIFIMLLSIFLRLISKNSLISNGILSVLCLLITIISYYKVQILEVPLLVTDIFLLKNVFQIAGYGNLFFEPKIVAGIILILELLLIQFFIVRKQEKRKMIKWEITVRVILAIIIFAILARGCVINKVGNIFYIPNKQFEFKSNYNSYGATFMFYKSIENLFPEPVEEYSEEKIEEIKNEIENTNFSNDSQKEDIKPNIIAIMSESLFDITKVENLEFSKDPLENIKEISNKYYGGNIISPSYAGGTSLPEFEFLTGLTTNFFNTNVYPYSQYVNGNINSIVRTYKNNGYECIAMHPNGGNFYNRAVAYEFLGFDKKIFIDDMKIEADKGRYIGTYITDAELTQEIIETYENSNEKENKFIFAVTMQNHTPHGEGIYSGYDIDVEFKEKVSESEEHAILAYTQGVYDADIAFKKLVEYFENVEEPTIIVLFGDHLPGMPSLEDIYYGDDNLKKHQTLYCVYANYEIEKDIKFEESINTGNLGLKILEMSNIEMPWYYQYIQNVYKEYPVITNQFIIDSNNVICTDVESKKIQNYRVLQYDLLHKRKYITVN